MKFRGSGFQSTAVLVCCAALIAIAPLLWANASPRFALAQTPALPPPATGEIALAVDADHSTVHWTLDSTLHTVHGTFRFQSGTVQIEPATGKASGEIVVSAASGDSGNEGRDNKMHKDVLESARYHDIIFRPDRVEGTISAQGPSHVQLHGILTLHGAEHELTVLVDAELAADHWRGSVKFTVPYVQWGLKNPSNFLLKVKPEVGVELELTGSLRKSAA